MRFKHQTKGWGARVVLVSVVAVMASCGDAARRSFGAAPEGEAKVAAGKTEQALDAGRRMCLSALKHLESIKDYRCKFVKSERVGGELIPSETMQLKVRHSPFSVYILHKAPSGKNGQEAIYVAGKNGGNLIAHTVGFKALFLGRMTLEPKGGLAMRDNRYPITNIGMKNLLSKVLETTKRERTQLLTGGISILENEAIDDRACRCLEMTNSRPREGFRLASSRLFVDKKWNVPVRYEYYEFPEGDDQKPVLVERYTYTKVEFNQGLTDKDFDPDSPQYQYPK